MCPLHKTAASRGPAAGTVRDVTGHRPSTTWETGPGALGSRDDDTAWVRRTAGGITRRHHPSARGHDGRWAITPGRATAVRVDDSVGR
ncbi:hypothetical protein [Kitasatospora sp. NBC_00315]|uniref:hypothetical protein n=1 Tax=Kitasatospora sp. NBC_00315 TaxID=2975963 RepID=UPI003251D8F2